MDRRETGSDFKINNHHSKIINQKPDTGAANTTQAEASST